ncbi:glycosyl hydrolase 108 family protein [Mesorhizobium sp. B2-3-12]|uniref:glycoside hydrolase family 108 protein n=1 Tax=Mesorhizobium sp. B2-3-12 TaxID=2589952 RepID=UPI001FEFA2BE|nr:glycosyl hydrolase 108 family protein [Mesorhizobium sp. B2-3-12]
MLAHEGGYSNHPADPGGATMKGVTQRVYDGYRKSKGLSTRSVKGIQTAELNEIYDRQYWDAVKGDLLPAGVDYVVFDGAVNSGPGRSIMWLQQALRPAYKGPIDLHGRRHAGGSEGEHEQRCTDRSHLRCAHELPAPPRYVLDIRQRLDCPRC